ncbi:transglutaminase domain-containing protein [Bacillus sp. B-jedd]|uniref:transglutaminase domain-containing protein n=1 Tax=Bacillus sp. B-jedd TaxID=1476857 RepID=UPI000662C2B3|nr:transglutaminase-like domain-containing protein [Bacillus sp. B-jedd]
MKRFLFIVILFFMGIVAAQPGLPNAFAGNLSKEFAEETGTLRNKDHGILTVLSYHVVNEVTGKPFLMPSSVVESGNQEIAKLAEFLTKGKETEYEKSKAIYIWVTENLEYDADTYFDAIRGVPFDVKSAMETFYTRKAMCMGFSHLNAALHRAAGIEAKVVYGNNHAWNEIKVDGRWTPQDTTKGAGYIDGRSRQFVHKPTMDYLTYSDMVKEGEYLW